MDRKAWIAVTLSVIGLIAYYWYYVKVYSVPQKRPVAAQTAPTPTPGPTATPPPAPAETPTPPTLKARSESLFTKGAEYTFSNDTGGIASVGLSLHKGENDRQVVLNHDSDMPIGAIGDTPGEAWRGFEMRINPPASEAVFQRKDSDGIEITKRFILPQGSDKADLYRVRMELEFRNTGAKPASRSGYFVSTGGAAPVHARDLAMYTRFEWYHARKHVNIDVNWFSASSVPLIGIPLRAAQSLYQEAKPDVTWAAVASQYFCTIVTSEKTPGVSVWARRFDTHKLNDTPVYGIQGGLGLPGFTVEPGATVKESFVIFAGPKELELLRKLRGGQDAVMNFGMFGIVSEVLLWAMNRLHGLLFNSYAAAIIVLTLIIKSLLWPVQNKATNEMRKMAALSPKMTEMREKYKDDPQKLNEEMMKLYREYGVNPFSGCLPMLIQIPIFFGFYSMLGSAIELRNSSFFWIHDLSQPDTIFHIPVINFPVNLLPILMAGTMVWQMVISPKSGDAMQQRIFYFMPVIFLVFCYNYASGLALYWTTQNLFSIVQLYLTRNKPLPTLEKKSVVAKREADAAKRKKKKRPGP